MELSFMRVPYLIIILLAISLKGFSQPGPDVFSPPDINLNQYPDYSRGFDEDNLVIGLLESHTGVITIDSTSDLSLVPLLRKEKNLSLKIDLSKIPLELKGFNNTQSLYLLITSDSTDISFLNEFENLEELYLEVSGDLKFSNYLLLDSLKVLEVAFSKALTSLEAFEKINSIHRISLRYVPMLKEFPEFESTSQIQFVQISQESGNGCSNCPPNPNKLDVSNLSRLPQLEELHLSNVNGLTEIPGDLSKKLRVINIYNTRRANGIRSHIEDVSHLNVYDNLEEISISGVHLKGFTGDFENLNLKKLRLHVYGLQDISGVFTTSSIGVLNINCGSLQSIKSIDCHAHIREAIFENGSSLEDIDFLLQCPNIESLHLMCNEKLRFPSYNTWQIPNILISDMPHWFYIRTENGEVVEKSEKFDDNIRE